MIITLVLNIIYLAVVVISSPLLALPIATLSTNFTDAVTSISSYLAALNQILPITTIIDLMALTLSFEAGYFTFKGIMWVVKRFPTQS